MDNLIHYFFKKERCNYGISPEMLSKICGIESYLIERYENNNEQLQDHLVYRLFNAININYREMKSINNLLCERIAQIYNKIIYYDLSYKQDFNILKMELKKSKNCPGHYYFLLLEMFVQYRDKIYFEETREKVDDFYDLLTNQQKQTYLLGVGAYYEDQNDLEEALDLYEQALDIESISPYSYLSEEKISVIYLKLFNLGKALEYCISAKKHYAAQSNFNRATLMKNIEGLLFMKMRNFDEALKIFNEALLTASTNCFLSLQKTLLNNLIMLHLFQNKFKEVLRYCEQLVRSGDKRSDIYFYKVWSYYKIQEPEAFQYVLDLSRNTVKTEYQLSLLHMAEALMQNNADLTQILISTFDSVKKHGDYEWVYFVLDILIDHLHSQQKYEECCHYFYLKKEYQDRCSVT